MNHQLINAEQKVSEIVRKNYRLADTLKKYGINYCCGGNIPLQDACAMISLPVSQVLKELQAVHANSHLPASIRFDEWPAEFLIDYIIIVHHGYIRKSAPQIHHQLQSFSKGHASKYPYMMEIAETFAQLHNDLEVQTFQEEQNLFPYLKQICAERNPKEADKSKAVSEDQSPLFTASQATRQLKEHLVKLRVLSHHYQFDPGVCTNHQVIYHKLKEFDEDLVQHIHLENNILIPRILQM